MLKRLAALMVAFTLAFAGFTFQPAVAYAAIGNCPAGSVCLWEHSPYWGLMQSFNNVYPCKTLDDLMYNKASGIYNRTNRNVYMWDVANCWSDAWLVSSGQSYSPMPSGWNDRVGALSF